ncbi:hypothetical protein Tco_0364318 [Tanacetum coccineum]
MITVGRCRSERASTKTQRESGSIYISISISRVLGSRVPCEDFCKIAKSVTKLTQKKVKFDWGDKQEVAFRLLKEKLCSAPILALPEGAENFIVLLYAMS